MMPGPQPYLVTETGTAFLGDARKVVPLLAPESVDCIVTSPPYYALRSYGEGGQIGQESTPEQYLEELRGLFRACLHLLKRRGSLWLNVGDTYYGGAPERQPKDAEAVVRSELTPKSCEKCGTTFHGKPSRRFCSSVCGGVGGKRTGWNRPKCLLGLPWRLATMMVDDGWVLRNAVVWHKPNHLPTSVKDRLACSYEHLFHFVRYGTWDGSKYDGSYYYDASVMRDATRNVGDVWGIPTRPSKGGHPAAFPSELIERPIAATCPKGGVVFDPFLGSGTVAVVASQLGRRWKGVELRESYLDLLPARLNNTPPSSPNHLDVLSLLDALEQE